MLFQQIALLSAIAATTAAVGVSEKDVPLECRAVCSSLVSTTQQCDFQTNDDLAELSCVCNSSNAGTIIPSCDACVAQFRRPDRDDRPDRPDRDDRPDRPDRPDVGDVRELLTRCNLSTIAYSSGILSSFPTPTGGPGGPGGPVVVTSGTAVVTLPPPTPTGGPNGNGQGGNGQGGNGQGGNNNRPQPVAQGGAPAQTATVGAALAALGAFGMGMVMALL